MKWNPIDERDERIADKGRWCSLENAEKKTPDIGGVYVFIDSDMDVKYIGKAGIGELRNEIQNAISSEKSGSATRVGWFATNSKGFVDDLAREWTDKYRPINNL